MILVIDCDLADDDVQEELVVGADIMITKLVHGKPYTCPALTPSKGKEVAKLDKEAYLFNISKVGQIFDCLVKDKQIKLLKGHKTPLLEELKGKMYCKWHHSWTHTTNNCTVFMNSIQKALKEERLKLAEKLLYCESLEMLEKGYSTVKAQRGLEKENSWYKTLNEKLGIGLKHWFGRARINFFV